jgi:TPP-dependent pyruvate/acetoin dehydrogenase alpha subunit
MMEERKNSPAARLYRSMYLIRRVEEEIVRLYPTDKIKSPVHLSIGQEAVSAAVCDHLERTDIVFGTYRGHALYLAKGGDVQRMMAELYGKVDGCARGKAGSMHLVDPGVGMMGTSAVVATGISNAVGAALALKMQKSKAIVACFFGEGAADEGAFHESMNFASLKKLPILFVCENNFYAIYSHVRDRLAGEGLGARARSYGIEAELIEDHEPLKLHERAAAAVAAVRRGEGPHFLECMTYRWRDHVGPTEDRVHKYRPDSELDAKIDNDNLKIVGDMLPTKVRMSIEAAVEKCVADAIAFAEASTFPEDKEVYDHVFAG